MNQYACLELTLLQADHAIMSDIAMNDGAYDNTHRAFLQAIIARQIITFEDAQPLLASIRNAHDPDATARAEDISRDDFDYYVQAINQNIAPFDMTIKSTKHQLSNSEIFALVNTTSDNLTQMATTHTADEIAFVRRVLNAMFETNNTEDAEVMAISGIEAVRLSKSRIEDRRGSTNHTSSEAGLTIKDAEHMLKSMVREGWFERSRAGYYSLTPRALMELREWLVDTYNEPTDEMETDEYQKIKTCFGCKEIITVGQRCPNRECSGRLHEVCVNRMFRAQGNRQICPVCNAEWTNPLPVGEKAALQSGNRQRQSNAERRRSSNMELDGVDDE